MVAQPNEVFNDDYY